MTIEQFKQLKVGDKVMIDGKENEVEKLAHDMKRVIFIEEMKDDKGNKDNVIDWCMDKKTIARMDQFEDKTFDFSTLKDNTFCIYDVKEGQADKIKVIMEELGMKLGGYNEKNIYYFGHRENENEYMQPSKEHFIRFRKDTKETYRKTATKFLEEYAEWKFEKHLDKDLKEMLTPHYKQYIGKEYAVHCKTQEEKVRVLKTLDSLGMTWVSGGHKALDYITKMDYIIPGLENENKGKNKGKIYHLDTRLSDLSTYTILSAAQFFGEEEEPKTAMMSKEELKSSNNVFYGEGIGESRKALQNQVNRALLASFMYAKKELNNNKSKNHMGTLKNGVLKLTDKVKKRKHLKD
jgi:hypothetical protein